MPTMYHCDKCDVEASSLDNWFTVSIGYFSEGPGGTPPGTRSFNGAAPDLIFHSHECRDAWCAQAGVPAPIVPEAQA